MFSKDIGGNEFAQNWRFDRASGQITLLTDGKSKNTLGPWANAGKQLAYTSTRRTRKDTDLYIVDPAEPTGDRLVAQVEGGGWAPLDWSPDDQRLLVVNYVSVTESYLWSVDVAKGEKTLLTEKTEAPVSWTGGSFPADGKAVTKYEPGQYLGLQLQVGGEEVRRNYSLSQAADAPLAELDFSVLDIPIPSWVHDNTPARPPRP